jgi:hypothetical protein
MRLALVILLIAGCDSDGPAGPDGPPGPLEPDARNQPDAPPPGSPDAPVCADPPPLASDGPWECDGLTGETTNPDRVYYTTSFGCWVDEDGDPQGDPGDNCIPACPLATLGCDGLSGPECERMLNWYTADSDRFGCGTRLKVTNPDTGDAAVVMVIDRGPNCSIENLVDFWVLDLSTPTSNLLFGGQTSATEMADVLVEVMPPGTPLGPWSGGNCDGR